MIGRRGLLGFMGVALAAPAIIRTPGLLMPVKPARGLIGRDWRLWVRSANIPTYGLSPGVEALGDLICFGSSMTIAELRPDGTIDFRRVPPPEWLKVAGPQIAPANG